MLITTTTIVNLMCAKILSVGCSNLIKNVVVIVVVVISVKTVGVSFVILHAVLITCFQI